MPVYKKGVELPPSGKPISPSTGGRKVFAYHNCKTKSKKERKDETLGSCEESCVLVKAPRVKKKPAKENCAHVSKELMISASIPTAIEQLVKSAHTPLPIAK